MKEKKKLFWDRVLTCFLYMLLGSIIFSIIAGDVRIKGFNKSYKQGQIDALNGIQNYDKIIRQDTVYLK